MAVSSTEPGSSTPPPRALGAIFLTIFLDLTGFSIIFPLFPAMLDYYLSREGSGSLIGQLVGLLSDWSGDGPEAALRVTVLFGGILGSLYSFLQFACAPRWGRWSDRVGRRQVLLLTVAGTALGYLLWFLAGNFLLLVLSRLVTGVMAGNLAVATAAVADVTTPEKRSKGMALVGLAFGLGFILGPGLGSAAVALDLSALFPATAAWGVNPFSTAALLSFLLSLVNLIWLWKRYPETNRHQRPSQRTTRVSWWRLSTRPERQAAWVNFIFIFAFAGIEFTLTFLAVERLQYRPERMWQIFLFVGVFLALTQGFVVRRYAQVIGERRMLWLGLGAAAFGIMSLGQAGGTFWFYVGLLGLAIGMGLANPSLTALASLYAPQAQQGLSLGIFRSSGALARATGPLSAALLYYAVGSGVAYAAGAAIAGLALFLASSLPRPTT